MDPLDGPTLPKMDAISRLFLKRTFSLPLIDLHVDPKSGHHSISLSLATKYCGPSRFITNVYPPHFLHPE